MILQARLTRVSFQVCADARRLHAGTLHSAHRQHSGVRGRQQSEWAYLITLDIKNRVITPN